MSKRLQNKRRELNSDWTGDKQRELDDYAKQLKTKLKNAESEWRKKESIKILKDEAKTWTNVKKWVGWKTSNQPEQLRDPMKDNHMSLGARNNCRIMNDYYLGKVKNI